MPTTVAYTTCNFFVGGMVNGSVNMIVAKNSSGESRMIFCSMPSTEKPDPIVAVRIAAIADAHMMPNTVNCRSLRMMSKPPISTRGNIVGVPIHQLAD